MSSLPPSADRQPFKDSTMQGIILLGSKLCHAMSKGGECLASAINLNYPPGEIVRNDYHMNCFSQATNASFNFCVVRLFTKQDDSTKQILVDLLPSPEQQGEGPAAAAGPRARAQWQSQVASDFDKHCDTYLVVTKGSQTVDDWKTNLNILGDQEFSGSVHSGFSKRADVMPLEMLKSALRNRKRVVFVGHSQGGAINHIAALRLMSDSTLVEEQRRNVFSVGYGSPFFGDAGVAEFVHSNDYHRQLLTIVHERDPVPSILTLRSETVLKKATDVYKKNQKLIDGLFNALPSWLNLQAIDSAARIAVDSLDSSKWKELQKLIFQATPVFVPIGSYSFLNNQFTPESDDLNEKADVNGPTQAPAWCRLGPFRDSKSCNKLAKELTVNDSMDLSINAPTRYHSIESYHLYLQTAKLRSDVEPLRTLIKDNIPIHQHQPVCTFVNPPEISKVMVVLDLIGETIRFFIKGTGLADIRLLKNYQDGNRFRVLQYGGAPVANDHTVTAVNVDLIDWKTQPQYDWRHDEYPLFVTLKVKANSLHKINVQYLREYWMLQVDNQFASSARCKVSAVLDEKDFSLSAESVATSCTGKGLHGENILLFQTVARRAFIELFVSTEKQKWTSGALAVETIRRQIVSNKLIVLLLSLLSEQQQERFKQDLVDRLFSAKKHEEAIKVAFNSGKTDHDSRDDVGSFDVLATPYFEPICVHSHTESSLAIPGHDLTRLMQLAAIGVSGFVVLYTGGTALVAVAAAARAGGMAGAARAVSVAGLAVRAVVAAGGAAAGAWHFRPQNQPFLSYYQKLILIIESIDSTVDPRTIVSEEGAEEKIRNWCRSNPEKVPWLQLSDGGVFFEFKEPSETQLKELFSVKACQDKLTLEVATLTSKRVFAKAIHIACVSTTVREFLNSSLYIGLFGEHNVGKTTFLQKVWNLGLGQPVGVLAPQATSLIHGYQLRPNVLAEGPLAIAPPTAAAVSLAEVDVFVVDNPGTSDFRQHLAELSTKYIDMISFVIFLVRAGTDYDKVERGLKLFDEHKIPFCMIVNGMDQCPGATAEEMRNDLLKARRFETFGLTNGQLLLFSAHEGFNCEGVLNSQTIKPELARIISQTIAKTKFKVEHHSHIQACIQSFAPQLAQAAAVAAASAATTVVP